MKTIKICIFIFLALTVSASAQNSTQDVVYLKNGSIIRGTIIEQRPGDSYKIQTGDMSIFVYKVDEIEKITKEAALKTDSSKPAKQETFYNKGRNKYISLGGGLGNAYGVFGIRVQQRFGKEQGFAYHAGLGVYPGLDNFSTSLATSAGVKFFYYKSGYINLTYGTIGRGSYYRYNGFYQEVVQETLFGPSVLLGADWFYTKRFGMNTAAGASFITNDRYSDKVGLSIDLGFIYKFGE
jgi:hypothetical protein